MKLFSSFRSRSAKESGAPASEAQPTIWKRIAFAVATTAPQIVTGIFFIATGNILNGLTALASIIPVVTKEVWKTPSEIKQTRSRSFEPQIIRLSWAITETKRTITIGFILGVFGTLTLYAAPAMLPLWLCGLLLWLSIYLCSLAMVMDYQSKSKQR